MKELKLTIAERVAAVKLFDEFKGNISTLSTIIEDVKGFVVKDEEWPKANLRKSPTDEEIQKMRDEGKELPNQTWNWDDEGTEVVVSVNQNSIDYLAGKIKAKSEAGELTLGDKALLALEEKLK